MKTILALLLLASPLLASQIEPSNDRAWFTKIGDSGSMRPVLQGGEIFIVMPIKWTDLRVGQIVIFRCDWAKEGRVVHRVIAKGKFRAITKGDHNMRPDPGYIRPQDLLGVLTTRIL